MTTNNYILHFKGRQSGAIGNLSSWRFEKNCQTENEFFDALYQQYEHISGREYYVNGVQEDFADALYRFAFPALSAEVSEVKA